MTLEQDTFDRSISKIRAVLSLRATSEMEFAEALFEWRGIFEGKYGEVKRGRDQKSRRAKERILFYVETYEQFGVRKNKIVRSLRRRSKIAPDVWFALQNTFPRIPGATLDQLAGCNPQEQRALLPQILAQRAA